MTRRAPLAAAWLSLLVLAGCASRGNPSDDPLPRCEPVSAGVLDAAVLNRLGGHYRLSFTTTSGDSTGSVTEARMTLVAAKGDLRRMTGPGGVGNNDVVLPYYGTLDLDVASLGGITAGSPLSTDSLMPGVLVIQQNDPVGAPRSVTIRVGSDANDRAVSRFDGAYFALRVTRLTREMVAGTWASGVRREVASGYFCAFPAGT